MNPFLIPLTLAASGAIAGTAMFAASPDGPGHCAAENASSRVSLAAMPESGDIVSTAVNAGSFNTLAAALGAADLVGALKGDGPFTVFAPSDDAFAKLPKSKLSSLLKPENKDALTSILTFHVVAGELTSADVMRRSGATSLNGQRIDFAVNDHGRVTINGATVTTADIQCSNGVIHVIDSVILPSADSIVDVADSAGTFNTLLAAAKEAGLASTLAEGGPFTVLAPTDEAFARLPEGTVATLLKKENLHKLAEILKYHVISGRAYASDAVSAGDVETLQGGMVRFDIDNGRLTVDGAHIIATDIDASNGVVHVIDRVILPAG